jgi:hypothetical protein
MVRGDEHPSEQDPDAQKNQENTHQNFKYRKVYVKNDLDNECNTQQE